MIYYTCNTYCFVYSPCVSGDTQLRPRWKWRDAVLGVCHGRRGNDKKLESSRFKLETVILSPRDRENKLFILRTVRTWFLQPR